MKTTSEKRQAIVEKVKKILALAKNAGATRGESEAAMAMAQKLIATYSIEEEMLRVADEKTQDRRTEEPVGAEVLYTFVGPRVTTWQLYLVDAIARVNGVTVWSTPGWKRSGGWDGQRVREAETRHAEVRGAGTPSNLERTRLMVTLIMEGIERLYREDRPKGLDQGHGKSWGFSFRNGCVVTIRQRLQEAKAGAEREAREKAQAEDDDGYHEQAPIEDDPGPRTRQTTGGMFYLARVDHAITRVNDQLKQAVEWTRKNMKLKTGGARRTYGISDAGQSRIEEFEAGRKAGERADINGQDRRRLD